MRGRVGEVPLGLGQLERVGGNEDTHRLRRRVSMKRGVVVPSLHGERVTHRAHPIIMSSCSSRRTARACHCAARRAEQASDKGLKYVTMKSLAPCS